MSNLLAGTFQSCCTTKQYTGKYKKENILFITTTAAISPHPLRKEKGSQKIFDMKSYYLNKFMVRI